MLFQNNIYNNTYLYIIFYYIILYIFLLLLLFFHHLYVYLCTILLHMCVCARACTYMYVEMRMCDPIL